ncbi:uncharacterized protein LOC113565548 [Drosophila persimilis]|uniref:Uncharacterized protein n=1 Tax=Drosophila pseudoobscura pseudoobscura TaxID=46245 RepID=A0A0R3P1V7_DROPS|nr:uncharacterized protein LOC26532983 [Drosophila pseudoobscura]XP_026843660.1 uncharacterized protein LOC113565548 [Drosophila persimilis]XP_026843661.1 uncharacterized protein LOC113565548 [Drosophila persimilis]
MSFINGLKKFATTTVGLMAIGIGSTVLIYTGHRFIVKPYQSKQRRLQAEACADYLFQQEAHPIRSDLR